MLLLDNRTPHAARLLPWLDAAGVEHAVLVAKVALSAEHGDLRPAREPSPIILSDEHYGAPESTSVRVESDLAPHKAGTDVVVLGSVHAPSRVTGLDVLISVGPVRRVVRVFGDRVWARGASGYQPSSPQPFTSMPLTWERAFGGVDPEARGHETQGQGAQGQGAQAQGLAHPPSAGTFDERNPLGVGFVGARARVEHHPPAQPRRSARAPRGAGWATSAHGARLRGSLVGASRAARWHLRRRVATRARAPVAS